MDDVSCGLVFVHGACGTGVDTRRFCAVVTLNGYGELLSLKQFDPWEGFLSSVRLDDAFCGGMRKDTIDLAECTANAVVFLGNDPPHRICTSDYGEKTGFIKKKRDRDIRLTAAACRIQARYTQTEDPLVTGNKVLRLTTTLVLK